MRRQKKVKLIYLILPVVILVVMLIFKLYKTDSVDNRNITEDTISQINEKFFSMEFDLDNRTVVADDKNYTMSELLNISDSKVQELINNGEINKLLKDKLIGDVDIKGKSISVENAFSTRSLFVETNEKSQIKDGDGVTNITKLIDDIYIVNFENAVETKNGYEDFLLNDKIKNVYKDYKFSSFDTSIDSHSVSSNNMAWGVNFMGLNHYTSKMNYLGAEEVKVAVFDSGINKYHDAFYNKQSESRLIFDGAKDYVNDDDDPSDDNGHGTAVAGVIAESTSDNVKIIPIKVSDSEGKGNSAILLQGVMDIYQDVDVINISMGIATSEYGESNMEIADRVFKKVSESGTIVVCSAGNDGGPVNYPACSPYTIASAAVDSNDTVTNFSSHGDSIDFATPGALLKLPSHESNNGYITASGTSFSSPFLAAAMAMVETENPSYSYTDVIDALKVNAIDRGNAGKDEYYGYGSVNFNYKMFSNPSIIGCACNDTEWNTYNTISLFAIASKNITAYCISTSEDMLAEWINIQAPSTELKIEDIRANNNGIYYLWVKDSEGHISQNSSLEINYIDTEKPSISNFTVNSVDYDKIGVSINAQDQNSGINEIKFYYKKNGDTVYKECSETVENIQNNQITSNHVFDELGSYTEYEIFVEVYDKVGNYITSEKIDSRTLGRINIQNKTKNSATVSCGELESSNSYTASFDDDVITVESGSDCCVIAVDENAGIYTKLQPVEENENEYKFNGSQDTSIIIAIKGDVNLSGSVNVMDAMKIISIIKGNEIDDLTELLADVKENERVNVMDAMEIINIIKGN